MPVVPVLARRELDMHGFNHDGPLQTESVCKTCNMPSPFILIHANCIAVHSPERILYDTRIIPTQFPSAPPDTDLDADPLLTKMQ